MAAGRINNSIHLGTRPKTKTQTFKAHTQAMKQADVQEIITEVRNLKTELKEFMSGHTTELEKQNLEAHVDLCSERYKGLHDRLSAIELRLQKMNEDMGVSHKSQTKTIIATAGTVVAGLLSTVVVILMKMPG